MLPRQSMMVWDLNTPDRVSNRYRLISILGLFYGERTLSAVVKGLPPSLVNYAIDIVVFLLRFICDDEDDDDVVVMSVCILYLLETTM